MYKKIILSTIRLKILAILLFLLTACQDSTIEYSCDNIDQLKKQVVEEDKKAQFKLAQCYQNGKGVEKDFSTAVEYYQKASGQNYANAQFNLGDMYEYGKGVEKDFKKAVEYYQKAADQNYAQAQKSLGFMYEYGKGVEKDFKKAVKYYQKAADQNYAQAQFNLGLMYKSGKGVEKDFSKAVEYYQKAADQNYANAQNNLGLMYEYGEGVEKNKLKGVVLIQKAADQGNQLAIDNLKSKSRGIAEPFGCKVAISDFNQISKLYKLKEIGVNKWNGGNMYNIDPISQVDFSGLIKVQLIFDKNQILQGVLAYFEKNKFNEILGSLEQKYQLINKDIPYVGNSSAKLFTANCDIALESLHLAKFLTLSFNSDAFTKTYNRQLRQEQRLKKQKEKSML